MLLSTLQQSCFKTPAFTLPASSVSVAAYVMHIMENRDKSISRTQRAVINLQQSCLELLATVMVQAARRSAVFCMLLCGSVWHDEHAEYMYVSHTACYTCHQLLAFCMRQASLLQHYLLQTSLWHTGAHQKCRRDVRQLVRVIKLSLVFYDVHVFRARSYLLQASLWQFEAH